MLQVGILNYLYNKGIFSASAYSRVKITKIIGALFLALF